MHQTSGTGNVLCILLTAVHTLRPGFWTLTRKTSRYRRVGIGGIRDTGLVPFRYGFKATSGVASMTVAIPAGSRPYDGRPAKWAVEALQHP